MSQLTTIIEKIFSSGDGEDEKIFPDVDPAMAVGALDLVARADERALDNLPRSDSTQLDPVETSVVDHFVQLQELGSRAYGGHLDTYARRLNEAVAVSAEVRSVARTAAADFKKSTRDSLNQIDNQIRRVSEIAGDYRTFRTQNDLRRTAVPRMHPMLNLGILMAMIVIESIVNGYFFAQGNALGLLGGMIVAFTVSIVNVGFSYLFGRLSRFCIHARFFYKLFGLMSFAAFLAWVGIFNMYVAHFRDAVGIMRWDEALSHSVTMFKANPFSLANFESWILALIGALISIAVFAKAIFWDDVYPGFGALSRRFEEAVDTYADFAAQAMLELEQLRDQRLEELEVVHSRIIVGLRESADILSSRSALGQEFLSFQNRLDRALNQALTVYRDANRKARSDAAPDYFQDQQSLEKINPVVRVDSVVENVDAIAKELSKDLTDTMSSIVDAYETAIDGIPDARSLREEAR